MFFIINAKQFFSLSFQMTMVTQLTHFMNMVGHIRCCVGPCDNDARSPSNHVKRGSVTNLEWFRIPAETPSRDIWIRAVRKGKAHFYPKIAVLCLL